ncbi:DUF438 domain-containing protein [Mycoplasmatota bacterium WC44]
MSEFINNREYRQEILKRLIKDLHAGKSVDEVKKEFEEIFDGISTTEISQLEQALIKEGMAIEEVQRLCDVHAAVFDGSIEDIHSEKDYSKIPGHPVNIFIEENKAIEKVVNEEILPHLEKFLEQKDNTSILMLRVGFDRLSEINIHYSRKENLLFPYLEKYEITAPPKVMWAIDDEVRAEIKEVISLLAQSQIDENELKDKVNAVTTKVTEMIFKENNILLPLVSDTLTFYEWIKIDEATEEMGYCLITPTESWKVIPPEETEDISEENTFIDGQVKFDAGSLTPEEINAILNTLPLDMTFVGADDKVKYFTQGKERIFDRPLTILGREVSNCHPPASVHIVEKIVDDLRSGRKENEDFWIRMGDLFIYIRYFAVRNKKGEFLGTLEISQNIKPITELEGEKRLVSE